MASQTSPPIRYKCPSCKAKLESPGELAGKEDTCPLCGKTCAVPKTKQQKAEERQREKQRRVEEQQRLRQQEEAERNNQAAMEQARLQSIRQAKTEMAAIAPQTGGPTAWKAAMIGGVVGAAVVGLVALLMFKVVAEQKAQAETARLALAAQTAKAAAQQPARPQIDSPIVAPVVQAPPPSPAPVANFAEIRSAELAALKIAEQICPAGQTDACIASRDSVDPLNAALAVLSAQEAGNSGRVYNLLSDASTSLLGQWDAPTINGGLKLWARARKDIRAANAWLETHRN